MKNLFLFMISASLMTCGLNAENQVIETKLKAPFNQLNVPKEWTFVERVGGDYWFEIIPESPQSFEDEDDAWVYEATHEIEFTFEKMKTKKKASLKELESQIRKLLSGKAKSIPMLVMEYGTPSISSGDKEILQQYKVKRVVVNGREWLKVSGESTAEIMVGFGEENTFYVQEYDSTYFTVVKGQLYAAYFSMPVQWKDQYSQLIDETLSGLSQ